MTTAENNSGPILIGTRGMLQTSPRRKRGPASVVRSAINLCCPTDSRTAPHVTPTTQAGANGYPRPCQALSDLACRSHRRAWFVTLSVALGGRSHFPHWLVLVWARDARARTNPLAGLGRTWRRVAAVYHNRRSNLCQPPQSAAFRTAATDYAGQRATKLSGSLASRLSSWR